MTSLPCRMIRNFLSVFFRWVYMRTYCTNDNTKGLKIPNLLAHPFCHIQQKNILFIIKLYSYDSSIIHLFYETSAHKGLNWPKLSICMICLHVTFLKGAIYLSYSLIQLPNAIYKSVVTYTFDPSEGMGRNELLHIQWLDLGYSVLWINQWRHSWRHSTYF